MKSRQENNLPLRTGTDQKALSNSLKRQANLLQKKGSRNTFSQGSEQQSCANSSNVVCLEDGEEAAQQYVQQFGRNVFPVGFVINPSFPHLGCCPDRRVYDATENPSRGLLEIKCSMSDYLLDLKYLKVNERSGTYSLRKTHAQYYQAMGCIGLTGSAWEDFFVYCQKEFHCERIYYHADYFSGMLEKFNMFYFNFHLFFVEGTLMMNNNCTITSKGQTIFC